MGPVDVSAACYYCQHCKHGHKPLLDTASAKQLHTTIKTGNLSSA